MATLVYSGIGVTEIFGSIGATTFQRNANGAFGRVKPFPTQPDTEYQLDQRAVYAFVFKQWAQLTEVQRTEWIAFAATPAGEYQNRAGQTKNYTGQQLFIRLNLAAYGISGIITNPPLVPSFTPNPQLGFSIEQDGSDITVCNALYTNDFDDSSINLKIYATPSLSVGISRPRRSLFKLLVNIQGDFGNPNYDFLTQYYDRFGLPTIGAKVFMLTVFTDRASGYEFTNSQFVGVVVAA